MIYLLLEEFDDLLFHGLVLNHKVAIHTMINEDNLLKLNKHHIHHGLTDHRYTKSLIS